MTAVTCAVPSGWPGGWLAASGTRSGLYPLYWSYNVTEGLGSPLWLRPGWYGANVQGEALSLLTRLYRATGERATCARRAARCGRS